MLTIPMIKAAVAEVAPLFSISSVDLFGSYAADCATEISDVDVLIKKASSFSLFDMCKFCTLLEKRLGVSIDVVVDTPQTTSNLIVDKRVKLYEQ